MPARRNDLQDLQIEFRFDYSGPVPATVISGVLERANRVLYDIEREEIEAMAAELSDIPEPIFNAVRYEMARSVESLALSVSDARRGSLILTGIAGAAAIWLLESTLGETFKEAWKDTDIHKRLVKFLSRRLRSKAQKVAANVESFKNPSAQVSGSVQLRERVAVVLIVVKPIDCEFTIPSIGEALTGAAVKPA